MQLVQPASARLGLGTPALAEMRGGKYKCAADVHCECDDNALRVGVTFKRAQNHFQVAARAALADGIPPPTEPTLISSFFSAPEHSAQLEEAGLSGLGDPAERDFGQGAGITAPDGSGGGDASTHGLAGSGPVDVVPDESSDDEGYDFEGEASESENEDEDFCDEISERLRHSLRSLLPQLNLYRKHHLTRDAMDDVLLMSSGGGVEKGVKWKTGERHLLAEAGLLALPERNVKPYCPNHMLLFSPE